MTVPSRFVLGPQCSAARGHRVKAARLPINPSRAAVSRAEWPIGRRCLGAAAGARGVDRQYGMTGPRNDFGAIAGLPTLVMLTGGTA